MTIHVVWPASVTVCIGVVPFLESGLSMALVDILPSLLMLRGIIIITLSEQMALVFEIGSMIISALEFRFLYLSPTTVTCNVTCAIIIETQNIIIHRFWVC